MACLKLKPECGLLVCGAVAHRSYGMAFKLKANAGVGESRLLLLRRT